MSRFELQPAVPTVKEIFDLFEEEFRKALRDTDSQVYWSMYEVFKQAKENTAIRLSKEVMPMT